MMFLSYFTTTLFSLNPFVANFMYHKPSDIAVRDCKCTMSTDPFALQRKIRSRGTVTRLVQTTNLAS